MRDDDTTLDVLLTMRDRMEAEIKGILDTVATRRKALEALNTTIGILHGSPVDSAEFVPAAPRQYSHSAPFSYDRDAIQEAVAEYVGKAGLESFSTGEVAIELTRAGLVPGPSRHALFIVRQELVERNDVEVIGQGAYTRYRRRAAQAA